MLLACARTLDATRCLGQGTVCSEIHFLRARGRRGIWGRHEGTTLPLDPPHDKSPTHANHRSSGHSGVRSARNVDACCSRRGGQHVADDAVVYDEPAEVPHLPAADVDAAHEGEQQGHRDTRDAEEPAHARGQASQDEGGHRHEAAAGVPARAVQREAHAGAGCPSPRAPAPGASPTLTPSCISPRSRPRMP